MTAFVAAGAAMGWRPAEVRAASLADFAAAQDGWARAQGIDPGPTRQDLDDLEALMARYPDKAPA